MARQYILFSASSWIILYLALRPGMTQETFKVYSSIYLVIHKVSGQLSMPQSHVCNEETRL